MRTQFGSFEALSGRDVYDVLALRQEIFVVEQRCAFLDADGLDLRAEHLLMRDDAGALAAYVRVLAPGTKFPTHSIGRVVVAAAHRSTGLGRRVMREAIARIEAAHGAVPITLSAQAHLEAFYGSLGFVTISDRYDEDGIPHVDMRRG
jgi:ElaA protein